MSTIVRNLPTKSRNMLHLWSEQFQLVMKYGALSLSHGTPGLQPPDFLLENLSKACKDGFNQYTLFPGHPVLRDKLAEFYSPTFKAGNNSQDLNPNSQILVTNGACEALFTALNHFVQQGDEVLTFEPYYATYVNQVEFAGAQLRTAPLKLVEGRWEHDFEAFEAMISEKTRAVLLNTPHNPSGKVYTMQDIKTLTKILDKHPQIVVISDEVYYTLQFDNRQHFHFANYGNNFSKTVTIFSGGKAFNATGWKVGWMIGPEALVKKASAVHEAACFNINVPGQIAIATSLDQSMKPYQGCKDYHDFVRKTFEDCRNEGLELLKLAKNVPWKPVLCEGGYFLAIDVSQCRDLIPGKYFDGRQNFEGDPNTTVISKQFEKEVPLDYAFCRWATIEKGLSFMPISVFCLDESPTKLQNYIRMAICKTKESFQEQKTREAFMAL